MKKVKVKKENLNLKGLVMSGVKLFGQFLLYVLDEKNKHIADAKNLEEVKKFLNEGKKIAIPFAGPLEEFSDKYLITKCSDKRKIKILLDSKSNYGEAEVGYLVSLKDDVYTISSYRLEPPIICDLSPDFFNFNSKFFNKPMTDFINKFIRHQKTNRKK